MQALACRRCNTGPQHTCSSIDEQAPCYYQLSRQAPLSCAGRRGGLPAGLRCRGGRFQPERAGAGARFRAAGACARPRAAPGHLPAQCGGGGQLWRRALRARAAARLRWPGRRAGRVGPLRSEPKRRSCFILLMAWYSSARHAELFLAQQRGALPQAVFLQLWHANPAQPVQPIMLR